MNTRNTYRWMAAAISGAALVAGGIFSQTSDGDPPENDIGGNDSPAGVTSGFNGWVNTGCAYDSYTGNVRRVIDEIVVPGSIGAYPLKWSRIYNSREAETMTVLGVGWQHSYQYTMSLNTGDIVGFPDGREIDFNERSGISERLGGTGVVLLADGGQLLFEGVPYNIPGSQHTRFRLARIVDPFGQPTVIGYENTEADQYGNAHYRMTRVTEPGGRYLKINYATALDTSDIASVEACDSQDHVTQRVSYTYTPFTSTGSSQTCSTLTRADYSDGTSAQYTYQKDNSSRRGSPGIPLLKTCNDVRYYGPMRQIEYQFVDGDQIHGKIKSEKKLGTGEAVSTILFPSGRQAQTRVETRGDGPKRTFTYSSSGRLLSYTDFKNNTSIATKLAYDANSFVGAVTDAGNHQTTYTKEPVTGRVTRVVQADQTSYIDFDYGDPNNPYYLWWSEDENRHRTYFYRDANHRIQQINYPGQDTPYETFAYNTLGQVLTHRRRNGFYEHFAYDAENRLRKTWNPTATATWPPSDAEPHVEFDYYPNGHPWADRVATVKDQAGHSTAYEYDRDSASQPCPGRGLVTRVTHLVDGTYISFAYDQVGNVIAAENELRKRTSFSYDDYNRVIVATPPLPAQPMTFTYERYGTSNPYLHTGRAVHIQTDGANVVVEKRYDENFRLNALVQQDGTASPPTTTLEYWPVGLLRTVHDPRNPNWTTSYTYTARNQLETVTDALSHRTGVHYDPAGNVDYIDRPDTKRQTRSYDEMNRVITAIEPVTDTTNKTTTFTYWPSGRVKSVEDNNHQVTQFNYDNWDRQQYMFYPDNTFQQWDYNQVGVLQGYRTVGGKIQRFQSDGRNRVTDTWWDPGDPSDWTHYDFDAANRLTQARNQNGTITRQYDDAGRLLTEEQNVYGLGAKTVSYGSDGAGKRNALGILGTDYQFAYQYDPLGRLEQILNVQSSPSGAMQSLWYQYSYDAASNQTQRYCPMNGIAQIYSRDQLGRIDTLTIQKATEPQYGVIEPPPIAAAGSDPVPPVPALPKPLSILVGLTNLTSAVSDTIPTVGTVISSEHYLYNNLSQVTAVQRANGQNDGFSYDYSGQLTGASYVGWYQGTGTRYASYTQDALGNRSQVTDNGVSQGYSPVQSYLNQYASGPAGAVSSDSEHAVVGYENLSYAYRNDGKLANVSGNGNNYYLGYDAFGRCVKRRLNNQTIYYTYDGPHPIHEWKADGTTAGWNLFGQGVDEILLRADYVSADNGAGQGFFYQQNRVGSVTHMLGFQGERIEEYRYDAFGTPVTTYHANGIFDNRFKFTGREYQAAFGIYEYRNRAYHPGLGRFLSEDPAGFAAGDTNLYRYCGGDPVNRRDPFGLDAQDEGTEGVKTPYKTEDTNSGIPGSGFPAEGPLDLPADANLNPPHDGSDSFTQMLLNGLPPDRRGSTSSTGGSGAVPTFGSNAGGSSINLGGGDRPGPSGPVVGGNGLWGSVDSHGSGDGGGRGGFVSAIMTWAQGVASAATMFGEFVSNSGPQVRIFGPNSVESADLRTDPQLMAKAAEAYKSPNGVSTPRTFPFPMGPIQAAFHPTRQFVGSYTVEIRNGEVVVMNRTSLWSGLGHLKFAGAPDRSEVPFGGNTYQAYIIGPYP